MQYTLSESLSLSVIGGIQNDSVKAEINKIYDL